MTPKQKAAEPKQPSAADRLVTLLKQEKIALGTTYQLHIADKFRNVCPQAVRDAISLGMIEAKVSVTAKDEAR